MNAWTYIFIARIIYQNVCAFWIIVDNMNVAHFKICARSNDTNFPQQKMIFLYSICKQIQNTQSIDATGSRVFTLTYFDSSFDSFLNRFFFFARFFIFMLATSLRLRFIIRSVEIRYFHKIDAHHSLRWMNEWMRLLIIIYTFELCFFSFSIDEWDHRILYFIDVSKASRWKSSWFIYVTVLRPKWFIHDSHDLFHAMIFDRIVSNR